MLKEIMTSLWIVAMMAFVVIGTALSWYHLNLYWTSKQPPKDFIYYYEICVTTMETSGLLADQDEITIAGFKAHCVNLASIKACTLGDCTI